MKFFIQVLYVVILGWLFSLFLPWWSIALAGFMGGYFGKSKANFTAGFVAIALLWFVHAWLIDRNASAPLTEKVASLLIVQSKTLLMVSTAVIGGLVGGFSTLTGSLLQSDKRRAY